MPHTHIDNVISRNFYLIFNMYILYLIGLYFYTEIVLYFGFNTRVYFHSSIIYFNSFDIYFRNKRLRKSKETQNLSRKKQFSENCILKQNVSAMPVLFYPIKRSSTFFSMRNKIGAQLFGSSNKDFFTKDVLLCMKIYTPPLFSVKERTKCLSKEKFLL